MTRETESLPTPLAVAGWDRLPGLTHGFLGRRGGVSPPPFASLNVGPLSEDDPDHIRRNLGRVADCLSIRAERIFSAAQVHGTAAIEVDASSLERTIFRAGGRAPRADVLVCASPDIYLGILTADCVPVLLYDPLAPAVGAAHAGWRGTLGGASRVAVERMCGSLGASRGRLLAATGPCIGPCCYNVGEDVAVAFREADPAYRRFVTRTGRAGPWRLDLPGLNRHQLLAAGLRAENLSAVPGCTHCRPDLFYSVRFDGPRTGRQISLVGFHGR